VRVGHGGVPLLEDALAVVECQVSEVVSGGTHRVFLARVVQAEAGHGSPLRYFRGKPVCGVLGDGPTVLSRQVSKEPEQEPAGPAPGLHTGKPAGHPFEEPVGLGTPTRWSYAVTHGHRMII
jgi:hypothetical protein